MAGLGCGLYRDTATTRPCLRAALDPQHGALSLRHGLLGPATWHWAGCDTAACAPGHVFARLCVLAGPAGCALGALSLFLDSVLFLSHFLGTVHHKNFRNLFLKLN